MKLAGKTDIGLRRRENQDDFRACAFPSGDAWAVVCDGMGGARGGKTASRIACDIVEELLKEQFSSCEPGGERALLIRILEQANFAIFRRASQEEELAGMGTTAVCAMVRGTRAHLCHAGDSRAYLLRGGRLSQLTHDHSYVQELVDCGTITPQQAEHHPQKNVITRALGVSRRIEPEYTCVDLMAGDRLLLCTDGLSNMVSADTIAALAAQATPEDVPAQLIAAANAAGGMDNITALLLCTENETEVYHG